MSHHINLIRIKGVASALVELKDDIAFVGGATVSLYADHPEQTDTRPTDDIDVLVEIATYSAYTKLQERLRVLGFALDTEAKITCRYKYQGLIVDIMPTEEEVLGFKSRWYKEGFKHLQTYTSEHGIQIRIFPVAYFIASKLDAFNDRSSGDGW
ncbi:MAG TPA: nucleotidyl transferase AbiEii/AbiGii toxin family protein [Flavipsychrobacter sp.]|nr:nucleotidyl transferase AbiEii/AbiGii toxin family protein [Flavipsychrobacter sp.]